jgi:hypothetical protein
MKQELHWVGNPARVLVAGFFSCSELLRHRSQQPDILHTHSYTPISKFMQHTAVDVSGSRVIGTRSSLVPTAHSTAQFTHAVDDSRPYSSPGLSSCGLGRGEAGFDSWEPRRCRGAISSLCLQL